MNWERKLQNDFYRKIINISYYVSLTLPFGFPYFFHYPYCVDKTVSIQKELYLKLILKS